MRNEKLIGWSLTLSSILVILGIGSAMLELRRVRQREKAAEGDFVSAQRTMRRLFTSAVLLTLGVLLFLGIHLLNFSPTGLEFLTYWGIVGLLVVWLFLCPLFDISETRRIYRQNRKDLLEQMKEQVLKVKEGGSFSPEGRAKCPPQEAAGPIEE